MPCCFSFWSHPSQNTETFPALSVRIVQPLAPLNRKKGKPDEEPGIFTTVTFDQLSPPSLELATSRVWAFEPTLGPPTYRAKQTYTFPKKSLLAALSAQICSLSTKA